VQIRELIYLIPSMLILLGIAVVFLWAAFEKFSIGRIIEKAPSSLMLSLGRRIGVQSIPVSHIAVVDQELPTAFYSLLFPIVPNPGFGLNPFLYGEAVPVHNQIEIGRLGESRIVRRYFKGVLAFNEAESSRYRYDLGWRPSLIQTFKMEKAGNGFMLSYGDNQPWTFAINRG